MEPKAQPLDKRIRVGIVSYLNTRPLLYGIEGSSIMNEVELLRDYPALVAAKLQENKIDVGLVPVAVIPHLSEYHIITNYCIGCDGPVASVCIFSEVPIEEIKTVLLDYQSRTSVALAKLLLKEYWKIEPALVYTKDEYQSQISGDTAGLLIGDRALAQRKTSRFVYDLGEAWKLHTGLPFVFAAWVSNKKLPPRFIIDFDEANGAGLEDIDAVVALNPYPDFDLRKYFTEHISYELDALKRKGLELFLEKIKNE